MEKQLKLAKIDLMPKAKKNCMIKCSILLETNNQRIMWCIPKRAGNFTSQETKVNPPSTYSVVPVI
jgi:hypothetical protein